MPPASQPDNAIIPELDGLRASSIALVVLSHLGLQRWLPGLFGVNVFFFISGFLITRLLLAETARTGRLDLGRFYVRRLLRLYPALIAAIVLGGAVYTALGGHLRTPDALAALLYAANLWELAGGFQSDVPGSAHPYGILWSLAVEEHFYIVFPWLVAALHRRPATLAATIGATILAVTLWRAHVALACANTSCHDMRVLHGSDTRIDSILWGAALTATLATTAGPALVRALRHPAAIPAGLACILLSLVIRDPFFRETWRFTWQGTGLFLAVGGIVFGTRTPWLSHVLSSPPARRLGAWSYSLYLWHWIVLMAAVQLLPASLQEAAMAGGLPSGHWLPFAVPVIAAALALAALSYHLVERPMLGLRRRWGSHA